LNRLIFGDMFYHGNLNDQWRELITLVALQLLYLHFSVFGDYRYPAKNSRLAGAV